MASAHSPTSPRPARRRLRFATEVLILQLGVVLAIVAMSTVIYAWSGVQSLAREAESTALAIAQSVAEDPGVRVDVAAVSGSGKPIDKAELRRGPLVANAEAVRERTKALFVVITDDQGLRLAHPDPESLGEPVSTSPDAALRGEETTSWETGTLGISARAKVPVYATDDATIVGEVSVGFAPAHVFKTAAQKALPVLAAATIALLLGLVASVLLGRRLRRLTLGLQPEELITLVQNQAAVLGGVGEGVLGVSRDGRVTVCNDQAGRLLGLDRPVGRPVARLGLHGWLGELILDGPDTEPTEPVQFVTGQRVLFIDVRTVYHDGQHLGRVVIVRDRTDVEALTRRLDAVAAMTSALRVQRHEFANRLHAISGLLEIGQHAEARSYLASVLDHGPLKYPVRHADRLTEPYLQAFLGAKGVEAAERGVLISLGPETLVSGTLSDPEDTTTVLGNLIDNAVTAAVNGAATPAWVEVELLDAGTELHISVMDSGDGLARSVTDSGDGLAQSVTDSGNGPDRSVFDPRSPARRTPDGDETVHGLGFGLPLSREIARRRGGDLWLASPGETDRHGAVFCARLPGVVAAFGTEQDGTT